MIEPVFGRYLDMATLGLGLAAIGRPGYINLGHAEDLSHKVSIGAMRNNAIRVLDAAWDSGVRYFDAARSYGRAEEFLGTWLSNRGLHPNDVTIGSKWGYTYTAAWQVQTPAGVAHEVKRHELSVLQSQYATSYRFLGTHLDLYQIHSATIESGVLENTEVLEFLNRIRSAGVMIGLSVSGPNQAETIHRALSIKLDNVPLFGAVQATWNLLERSAEEALATAHQQGLNVIVKEALANGRLTEKNQTQEFAEPLRVLQSEAAKHKTTVDALALAAALNQPWATTVLSGAANVEHLESNLASESVLWTESTEMALNSLAEPAPQYWNTRSQLPWN